MDSRDRVSAERLAEPVLSFEQAEVIAAKIGTPFLVLSTERLRRNVAVLRDSLPDVELFYALKSNPHARVLTALKDVVDGIDIASLGEARLADAAGYGPERLIHTNPVKKLTEIHHCIDYGIRWFVFDTLDEIEKLQRFDGCANVLLRLAIPHATCTVDLSSKFGVVQNDVVPLLSKAKQLDLRVRGVTFHVGSQCQQPRDYERAFELAEDAFEQGRRLGFEFDTLDIGGGLPVPYRTPLPQLGEYFAAIRRGLTRFDTKAIRILAEPGRCISGDSMTLVVSVTGRAVRQGIAWYYIDDGLYGAFSGKVFDKCDYRLLSGRAGPVKQCVIAGPTCDSIDIVARDQLLPDMGINDLLLVPGMGAYTTASATSFNGFPPPRVVLLPEFQGASVGDWLDTGNHLHEITVGTDSDGKGLFEPVPASGRELIPMD